MGRQRLGQLGVIVILFFNKNFTGRNGALCIPLACCSIRVNGLMRSSPCLGHPRFAAIFWIGFFLSGFSRVSNLSHGLTNDYIVLHIILI